MNADILKLLQARYFLPDEKEWIQLARRVGKLHPPVTPFIESMVFVPGSPILMNACTDGRRKGTLSSCFPMAITDSMEGIMQSMTEAALVTKMCGGVGYDFSTLRGAREIVKTTGREAGGVMPFIGIYNAILDGVIQGSARRGAGMSLLSVYHPDILHFLDAKRDLKAYNRTNFSVKIDEDFYRVLEKYPDRIFHTINVLDGKKEVLREGETTYTYKMLWDKIIDSAWTMAEPGIFNESPVLERSALTHIGRSTTCNPCGEIVVTVPYISCNLSSINLSRVVKLLPDGKVEFDWEIFGVLIDQAVMFLNAVIDANVYPIQKIADATRNARPIGLGVMGLAHLLCTLRIPYDSEEGKELTQELASYMTLRAMKKSNEMAKTVKMSFPWYDHKVFMEANARFFKRKKCREIDTEELAKSIKEYGMYNSGVTSFAPTGTISTLAECSSGIEPTFALAYTRKVETGNKVYTPMRVVDPVFKARVEYKYKEAAEKIYKYVADNSGSCQGCEDMTKEDQRIFRIASDISPERHLDILEAAANNVSYAVSKTINLPAHATREDISKVYLDAQRRGIIGVTVYRDGCREGVLIRGEEKVSVQRHDAPERPQDLECDIHHIKVLGEKVCVVVGKLRGMLYEIFVAREIGKIDLSTYTKGTIRKVKRNHYDLIEITGEKVEVLIENLGKTFGDSIFRTLARFISMSLRSGSPLPRIVEQLNKSEDFASFDRAVARVLKVYIKDGEVYEAEKCPECQGKLFYYDGCVKCHCGWSRCG